MSTARETLVSGLFGRSPAASLGIGIESSTSYLFPAIAIFAGLVMVAVLIYIAVLQARNRPTLTLTNPVDLWEPSNPVIVDRMTVRNQMQASYTLALYIKLDAVPDIRSTGSAVFTLPGVMDFNYDAASETLALVTRDISSETVRISGFPLQRWNQLTLTLEGRTLDIYVNGQLSQSALLNNVPPSGNASITIVPNSVMGSAAYAQVWSRRLTVAEVGNNYVSTSDSQGRPFIGNTLLAPLQHIPNLFCPGGDCDVTTPTASPAQQWEFPYA
jgi:hypothetical protein